MHDWRNFNNVSFESIIDILYDKTMTIVIHPAIWSHHPFVSGLLFFWEALYSLSVSKYYLDCSERRSEEVISFC